jgi:HD-GYP domain-containing protein (c-di-GMP phosphodiesterase class II)
MTIEPKNTKRRPRKNRHSLNSSVHRMLLVRMSVVGAAISLVLGLSVLYYQQDKVSEAVVENTVRRAELFASQYSRLFADVDHLDGEAIRKAILEFRRSRGGFAYGEAAYVGIFTPGGRCVTEIYDDSCGRLPAVRQAARELKPLALAPGGAQYETLRLDGVPHLRISLAASGGEAPLRTEMIFAFSDATIREFRMAGLRAAGLAILVVLLTTLALYPIVHGLTQRIAGFSVRLLDANLDTLETLGSAIAKRDSDTSAHNYRVTLYAAAIGRQIGLPAETMRTLIKGAFLHDVGKIGIPDRILLKPGKLDEEEFRLMKTHVILGGQIIQRSTWLHDTLDIVLSHHEKVEGSGYTKGLAGASIPVTARVFAIADVFDALTSKRPYKDAWPFEKAMEILEEGRGTQFSPDLLDAFRQVARPLYDRLGGQEEVPRDELAALIRKYFTEELEM